MPSVCSESPRRRRRLLSGTGCLALALSAAWLAADSTPAFGRSGSVWRRGAFPVASFAGFTSPFGLRRHPILGGTRPHNGLDIAAPLGSPVRSWWSGSVAAVINDGACGNGLVIRSGHYEHIYCHLGGEAGSGGYRSRDVSLRVGQRVRTGETIGHVGLSGSTTGPHLHWGVRYGGRWLDPARVLRAMATSRRSLAASRARVPNLNPFR
jgi:murein DD-endopeptidase MepM/ murein hydrolase activator NlpD